MALAKCIVKSETVQILEIMQPLRLSYMELEKCSEISERMNIGNLIILC